MTCERDNKMSEKTALLTLTISSVELTKAQYPNFTFKAKVSSTSSCNGFTSKDEGGAKLARELNSELKSIRVDLTFGHCKANSSYSSFLCYLNLLMNSSGKSSILGKLRDRFQDKVKVSVSLTPLIGDFGALISAEQMTISSHKNKSACTMRYNPDPALNINLPSLIREKAEWKLCIKIYVPDHLALASAANILVPDSSAQFDEPQFLEILEKELFCDVTISAGNGAEIKAHRMCLAAASPVLRETLIENSANDSLAGTLDMKDMSEKGVRAFLRYLYGKDLKGPKEDIEVALDLLYAAHKYHLPKLEAMMASLLEEVDDKDFGVKLAFLTYSFTKLWNSASALRTKAIRILKLKLDELEELQEYQNLFRDDGTISARVLFRDILKSPDVFDQPEAKTVSAPEEYPDLENAPENQTDSVNEGKEKEKLGKSEVALTDQAQEIIRLKKALQLHEENFMKMTKNLEDSMALAKFYKAQAQETKSEKLIVEQENEELLKKLCKAEADTLKARETANDYRERLNKMVNLIRDAEKELHEIDSNFPDLENAPENQTDSVSEGKEKEKLGKSEVASTDQAQEVIRLKKALQLHEEHVIKMTKDLEDAEALAKTYKSEKRVVEQEKEELLKKLCKAEADTLEATETANGYRQEMSKIAGFFRRKKRNADRTLNEMNSNFIPDLSRLFLEENTAPPSVPISTNDSGMTMVFGST